MLRTALTLSAAAVLMLSTSAIAQAQEYGDEQADSQIQLSQPDATTPENESHDAAIIEQHEEGVIEPNAGESAVDDPHGLDAADELARSDAPDDIAMPEDSDANDLAQASPTEPDLMEQATPEEDLRTDASPGNAPDLDAEPNADGLEALPAPDNQQ